MIRYSSFALRKACRTCSRASFASIASPLDQEPKSAVDKLHRVIEMYRQTNFPETVPHEFVEQVLSAADSNKDDRISVDELHVMLRNLKSLEPVTREEVQLIMELDLQMEQSAESVPIEKVKMLLLEICH